MSLIKENNTNNSNNPNNSDGAQNTIVSLHDCIAQLMESQMANITSLQHIKNRLKRLELINNQVEIIGNVNEENKNDLNSILSYTQLEEFQFDELSKINDELSKINDDQQLKEIFEKLKETYLQYLTDIQIIEIKKSKLSELMTLIKNKINA